MKTLARIASALLAASAFLLPLSAMAGVKTPQGHHHGHESAFPMKAEAFKKIVDHKVEKLKDHMEKGLEKRSMGADQKAEIEKSMDAAMKELNAAVEKVGADGVVTRDEAKQIKVLSEQLRNRMRAELKGKHAGAKTKGDKPEKGKGKANKPLSKKSDNKDVLKLKPKAKAKSKAKDKSKDKDSDA